MTLKTKINIANGIGIISFLVGTALLLFSPLATLLIFVGVCCLYLMGKWQKQASLQAEGQGIPGPVPSADARKRNLLIVTIGIGVSLMVTTPLFLYLSPGLQREAPAFIGGDIRMLPAYYFCTLAQKIFIGHYLLTSAWQADVRGKVPLEARKHK